jgi:threonine dehydrogenase-like Zn-dependent dehydrogenase
VCTSVSIFFEPVELPLLQLYSNGVQFITGRPHVRTLLPEIHDAITSGTFDPTAVPAHHVPWDHAIDALTDPADKIVIVR